MKAGLTLAFALLLICTGAALADTPDGTPPSGETVCDGEVGAAYGLCTAYCEAMDCESDDPSASETACNKVGTKFQNITGRAVPCEVPAVTCPCTSLPQFDIDLAGMVSCEELEPGVFYFMQNGSFINHSLVGLNQPNFCGVGSLVGGANVTLPTTPEEHALCLQLVLDSAASHGQTCE
jgi:hypothetical protein